MTNKEAIKIIKENAVQKFPSKTTATDFAEARNMLLSAMDEIEVLDITEYEGCELTIKLEDHELHIEWGYKNGKPKFTYFSEDGKELMTMKEWSDLPCV